MQPLRGVRVLDLTRYLPGPMCTWYLQGLGAEVIKVEDPRGGDPVRHVPPFLPDGTGAWFAALNAGKRSVTLDLRQREGVAAVRALAARVDVLVEGFRPGFLARCGLDPAELRRSHPRLVIASLTGFGQTGPWRDVPGHDLGYCALSGALSLGERRDDLPAQPGLQVADIAGGSLTGALAIVAALFARERTGEGDWIDVSITEGTLALVAPYLAATAAQGRPPRPGAEALTGALPNYRLYRCADGGVVALAALEPKFWEAFQRAVGEEVPLEHDAVARVISRRPRDEWAELLREACGVAVLELNEVEAHPLHRARRAVVGEGSHVRVRPPFAGAEAVPLQPVPALGEHTEAILAEAGLSKGT